MLSAKRTQRGASLIEMMVASLVGLVALTIVGSVFISGYEMATERSKELLLRQNVATTLQMIKEDIQRAGYNGTNGSSLKLEGAANTIYIQDNGANDGLIAYAYEVPVAGGTQYRNVMYRQSNATPTQLHYCESEQATVWNVANLSSVSGCTSMFAEKQIRVNQFDVTQLQKARDNTASSYVGVTLGAYLRYDNQVTHTMSVDMLERNWQ